MTILCALFGHRQAKAFQWGRRPVTGIYATRVEGPVVDGIGRAHFRLYVECPRCGKEYEACNVHGHQITDRIDRELRA